MAPSLRAGSARAAWLIEHLGLAPHPEGGWYGEVFRSATRVEPEDGRGPRAALTTIYFLLCADERSALHRVTSDEVWHFYEGDPLELVVCGPGLERISRARLGPVAGGVQPVAVVPAGSWQAARSTGHYSLVGCSVGPGFDFADFRLLREEPGMRALLGERTPDLLPFL